MIEPGAKAPDFTLPNHRGEQISLSDFEGRKVVLAFYPNDFSPVCSDQLSVYQEVLPQISDAGAELIAQMHRDVDQARELCAGFEPPR